MELYLLLLLYIKIIQYEYSVILMGYKFKINSGLLILKILNSKFVLIYYTV